MDPLVLHFQPNGGECEYFPYRRREVLAQLLASNADILVAGDSMMRQVFSRLVQMMRGQRRILDCASLFAHTPEMHQVTVTLMARASQATVESGG